MNEKKERKLLDELTELAGKEGIEIPDELLDDVAGGISPEKEEAIKRLLEKYPELASEIPTPHQGEKIDLNRVMLYLLQQRGQL